MGLSGASTTDSLDPATLEDIFPQTLNTQIRNRLVEIDYQSKPIPELAESWESAPDAVTWTSIGKNQRFFDAETPTREYDPDQAKFYLKAAGLEGHTFKLHTSER